MLYIMGCVCFMYMYVLYLHFGNRVIRRTIIGCAVLVWCEDCWWKVVVHVTHLLCKVGGGGVGEVRWCDEGSGMKVVRCAVLGGRG